MGSICQRVRKLLYSVDMVVVSARCHGDLLKFAPTILVVTAALEVDHQSMEFLRRQVAVAFDHKGDWRGTGFLGSPNRQRPDDAIGLRASEGR